MKFRKMSVPFAPQPGISGIFGRMESAHNDGKSPEILKDVMTEIPSKS